MAEREIETRGQEMKRRNRASTSLRRGLHTVKWTAMFFVATPVAYFQAVVISLLAGAVEARREWKRERPDFGAMWSVARHHGDTAHLYPPDPSIGRGANPPPTQPERSGGSK